MSDTETEAATFTHGASGYTNFDCRCETCAAGHKGLQVRLRASRRARLLANPELRPHGVYNTYANWCCRCEACKAVGAAYGAAHYAATKAEAAS